MWEGGGRNLIKHSQLTVAFDIKPKNMIIIYICKAAFLTAYSALQLLRTFTLFITKYTSATDALSQVNIYYQTKMFAQTKIWHTPNIQVFQPYCCLHRQKYPNVCSHMAVCRQYSTHQISKCLQPYGCLQAVQHTPNIQMFAAIWLFAGSTAHTKYPSVCSHMAVCRQYSTHQISKCLQPYGCLQAVQHTPNIQVFAAIWLFAGSTAHTKYPSVCSHITVCTNHSKAHTKYPSVCSHTTVCTNHSKAYTRSNSEDKMWLTSGRGMKNGHIHNFHFKKLGVLSH